MFFNFLLVFVAGSFFCFKVCVFNKIVVLLHSVIK
nr:MAG TPA: hypothetical protein [Caudoviricetes sp.]